MSNQTVFIGIDDTDTMQSRGTGRLARYIAQELSNNYSVLGVTRHQLLVDPRVPYTSHNSCLAIHLEIGIEIRPAAILNTVIDLVMSDFIPGSDPGVSIATSSNARQLIEFGHRAQHEYISINQAHEFAARYAAELRGLAGSEQGVIGALAAIGLASGGEDGRYILVGRSRELSDLRSVKDIIETGIHEVRLLNNETVLDGLVLTDKLRPARREGRPILFVEPHNGVLIPVKLD